MPEPKLYARKITVPVPACDTGRHVDHPGETCAEWEAYCAAARAWWEQGRATIPAAELMQMSEVPTTLRGPNWPGSA